MTIFDKQIHCNEIKLRILATDTCNQKCIFCLNDFQLKPHGLSTFIDTDIAVKAIHNYSKVFSGIYPLQVYFSGGEPTLHPDLHHMIQKANQIYSKIIINTNGKFSLLREFDLDNYLMFSEHEFHFGTYKIDQEHAERAKRMHGSIQCVWSSRFPYVNNEFIEFYAIKNNLSVKIFQDFNDPIEPYKEFCYKVKEDFKYSKIDFRWSGIQENRGPGCNNCQKNCITLRAAWLFPNGGISPCPQTSHRFFPKTSEEWIKTFQYIKEFHEKA